MKHLQVPSRAAQAQRPCATTHRALQQLAQVRREPAVCDVQQQAGVLLLPLPLLLVLLPLLPLLLVLLPCFQSCLSSGPGRRRRPADLDEGHGARRHTRPVRDSPLNVKP